MTAKKYHRMPYGFGPYPGPRQIPESGKRDPKNSPQREVASVIFASRPELVDPLLPPGFSSLPEARVIVEVQHLRRIDWLAGRDYSTLGVKFPVSYAGRDGVVTGDFLAVLWENLADPVTSGREELGFAKLWCEIREDAGLSDELRRYRGAWLGHEFVRVELSELRECSSPPGARQPVLHYKYIPRTGVPGEADVACATMTPAANPDLTVLRRFTGSGSVHFEKSTWEQLPTLFHIVNALADLPLDRCLGATLTLSCGGKDLGDQVVLPAADAL
jgi:hypothetical protein